MDINLARTFLTVAETGSFIEAARKINVTQSTVSARIKSLEEHLEKALFERSKHGATLTHAGEQFRRHALALVRVWQHAQIDVSGSDKHRDRLSVGAPVSLWDGFLLKWLAWLRTNIPDIAVAATALPAAVLSQRMLEGTMDLAISYRPIQYAGIISEHLFDEEFVMVTSVPANQRRRAHDYVLLDWGPDFEIEHATENPALINPDLSLAIGAIGVDYMLTAPASGYCPMRLVKRHLGRGRLELAKRARRFNNPVYMAYPEVRDEEAYEPILVALRKQAQKLSR
ncbi:MAG: LysR family transcriptional regulator [Hyphomicrobiaceae bacterium]|nr:LysR family transcriptional regulator [Hyphomicrobiaceae bacterium]